MHTFFLAPCGLHVHCDFGYGHGVGMQHALHSITLIRMCSYEIPPAVVVEQFFLIPVSLDLAKAYDVGNFSLIVY
jgi:hypothetical protein